MTIKRTLHSETSYWYITIDTTLASQFGIPSGDYICPNSHEFDINFQGKTYVGFVYSEIIFNTNKTIKLHTTTPINYIYLFAYNGNYYINKEGENYNPYTMNVTELVLVTHRTSAPSLIGAMVLESDVTDLIATIKEAWNNIACYPTRPSSQLPPDNQCIIKENTILSRAQVKIKDNPSLTYQNKLNIKFEDLRDKNTYLEFTCINSGTISMNHTRANTISVSDGGMQPTIYCSINNSFWLKWDFSSISVLSGDIVRFRGDNPYGIGTYSIDAEEIGSGVPTEFNYSTFVTTGLYDVSGNIMALIDSTVSTSSLPSSRSIIKVDYFNEDYRIVTGFYFLYLFNSCNIRSATSLQLAANTQYGCYTGLFENCSSLINPVSTLISGTMTENACEAMFKNCTSLASIPLLPSTSLERYCYRLMFNGCSFLNRLINVELPATVVLFGCYEYMFANCTSLINMPTISGITLNDYCYHHMFENCTSLTETTVLSATTLQPHCYKYMFSHCISLYETPTILATTLSRWCCAYMFENCTNLHTACTLLAYNAEPSCYRAMFINCSALQKPPEINVGKFYANLKWDDSCCQSMFENCTSLNIPANERYILHAGSTPLIGVNREYMYYRMFANCTSLEKAPVIGNYVFGRCCYKEMFQGCSNLHEIEIYTYSNPGSIEECKDWVYGVPNTGTFKVPHSNWTNYWSTVIGECDGKPVGWDVLYTDE